MDRPRVFQAITYLLSLQLGSNLHPLPLQPPPDPSTQRDSSVHRNTSVFDIIKTLKPPSGSEPLSGKCTED